MNAGEGHKYAAAYNPKTDTVALFKPGSAERLMLNELMHAATLKALARMVVIDKPESGVAIFSNHDGAAIPEAEWLSVGVLTDLVKQLGKPLGAATVIPVRIIDRPGDAGVTSNPDDYVASGFTFKQTIFLVREGLVDRSSATRTFWHELLHFGLCASTTTIRRM